MYYFLCLSFVKKLIAIFHTQAVVQICAGKKRTSICTILCDIFSLKTSSTISISAGKLLHLTEAGQDQVHFKFAYVIKEVQIVLGCFYLF